MFKTTYPNINISVQLSDGKLTVFNRFLKIISLKYGLFSPKIVGEKIVTIRFWLFKTIFFFVWIFFRLPLSVGDDLVYLGSLEVGDVGVVALLHVLVCALQDRVLGQRLNTLHLKFLYFRNYLQRYAIICEQFLRRCRLGHLEQCIQG